VVQEDSSDAALREVIADDLAPERKKAVAREVLKRRRHSESAMTTVDQFFG